MGPGARRGQDSLIRFIVFALWLTLGRGAHIPRKRSKDKKIEKKNGTPRKISLAESCFSRASMAQTASARRVCIRHAQSYFEREKARALKFSFARTRSRRKLAGSTPTFIGQSWNISIEFVHISSFRESRGSITRRSKPCSIRFELGGKNLRRGTL